MFGDWNSRDMSQDQNQWQGKWSIWEFLILRHNDNVNNCNKQQVKNYLRPLLILNKKAIKLTKI